MRGIQTSVLLKRLFSPLLGLFPLVKERGSKLLWVCLFYNSINCLKKKKKDWHYLVYGFIYFCQSRELLMRSFLLCNYRYLTWVFWIPPGQVISKYTRELASQTLLVWVIHQHRQTHGLVLIPSFLEKQYNLLKTMKELF